MQIKKSISYISVIFLILTFIIHCSLEGENKISSELFKPVKVNIKGTISDSQSSIGLPNITIKIKQISGDKSITFLKDALNNEIVCQSDQNGGFIFNSSITLEVDSYEYYLYLLDPNNNYFTNDSMVIYSIQDASLVYDDLKMVTKKPKTTTNISGRAIDVILDTVLSNVNVTLSLKSTPATQFTTTTDSNGAFIIENLSVDEYALTVDGSNLNPSYVKETYNISLVTAPVNDLGDYRLVQAITGDDMRVILSWNQSSQLDLDIYYTYPREDFDFNHLGVTKAKFNSSDISINPAFGFASNTAYWPANMGGDDNDRYTMYTNAGKDYGWLNLKNRYIIHPGTGTDKGVVIELDRNSTDGSKPEVLTIYKKNFLTSYPKSLSYYYEFNRNEQTYNYFPAGMGVFMVKCQTCDTDSTKSIYDSGAVVKMYQGNEFLGSFDISNLSVDKGESNRVYWSVMQIELGYTNSSPLSPSDIYFRPVPYGSNDFTINPSDSHIPYFYNEPLLPFDVTFTAYYDISNDLFSWDMVHTNLAVIGTDTGVVYPMSESAMTKKDYAWRPLLASTLQGPIKNLIGQFNNEAIYACIAPPSGISALYANQRYLPANSWTSATTYSYGINDMVCYDIMSSAYVVATTQGVKKGTGSGNLNVENPVDVGWTGSYPTDEVNNILFIKDKYGALTNAIIVGAQSGLYEFYLPTQKWTQITDADPNVTAMTMDPKGKNAYVATYNTSTKKGTLFYVSPDTDSGLGGTASKYPNLPNLVVINNYKINDLKTKKIGPYWYLFVATSNGVYYKNTNYLAYGDAETTIKPYTLVSPLISGIDVLKIIDYKGQLGLLTRNNGLIYGPYPALN